MMVDVIIVMVNVIMTLIAILRLATNTVSCYNDTMKTMTMIMMMMVTMTMTMTNADDDDDDDDDDAGNDDE